MDERPLPRRIGAIAVPQDPISAATWRRARRALPAYLFDHSVRSYCWGAAIAAREGLPFEPRLLWPAALLHDIGLTRIGRSRACFEYDGADVARRFVLRQGMSPLDADRVARVIVLHMAPAVTLADGPEAVLLDRATGLDVAGFDAELVEEIRRPIDAAHPRGAFDRLFLAAIRREVAHRTDCQSARLLPGLERRARP
jgi:HD superfamily phosphodiesterase